MDDDDSLASYINPFKTKLSKLKEWTRKWRKRDWRSGHKNEGVHLENEVVDNKVLIPKQKGYFLRNPPTKK